MSLFDRYELPWVREKFEQISEREFEELRDTHSCWGKSNFGGGRSQLQIKNDLGNVVAVKVIDYVVFDEGCAECGHGRRVDDKLTTKYYKQVV